MTSRRFYCYVDETGQDTKGNIFIVSVIISAQSQEEIAEFIREKDENNPMIRLADSVCGFVRDVLEEKTEESERIFKKAVKDKVLVEV